MNAGELQIQFDGAARERGLLVRVLGEVDLRSSPVLREQLLRKIDPPPARLVIDLTGVEYIDSSGVGTLVELKRRLDRAGARIVLVGLQPRVRSVFEITRLDRFFTIAASLEQAWTL